MNQPLTKVLAKAWRTEYESTENRYYFPSRVSLCVGSGRADSGNLRNVCYLFCKCQLELPYMELTVLCSLRLVVFNGYRQGEIKDPFGHVWLIEMKI